MAVVTDRIDDPVRWSRLVRQVATATGRHDEAGDHLNSAWLKLVEYGAPRVRNVEAFIVRVAINLARDEARRRGRREADLPPADLEAVADPTPSADQVLEARQRLEAVQSQLAKMNPRTARIVVLHRVDGLTYGQIAQRLAISESAVEKHMAKATLTLMKLRAKP